MALPVELSVLLPVCVIAVLTQCCDKRNRGPTAAISYMDRSLTNKSLSYYITIVGDILDKCQNGCNADLQIKSYEILIFIDDVLNCKCFPLRNFKRINNDVAGRA